MKNGRREDTLSHVYGIGGIIPGVLGLVVAMRANAPWTEIVLFATGWVTAGIYALMLIHTFNQARRDGEQIGELTTTVRTLEAELQNRNSTLDFLASLHVGKAASPRTGTGTTPTPVPGQPNDPNPPGGGQ